MAVSETGEMAMWSGVAGLTSFVGAFSIHEAIAKEYSPALEVEWRQMFPMHGGTAGVFALAGGAGYTLGRGKLTLEGTSLMGLGLSLMVSDFGDAVKWFSGLGDVFLILVVFIIGLIIGLIVRWFENRTENMSGSVA